MHQDPSEKGWLRSRIEDFLATDQEKRKCGEILMRSTLGLWDGLESTGARVEESEGNWTQRQ